MQLQLNKGENSTNDEPSAPRAEPEKDVESNLRAKIAMVTRLADETGGLREIAFPLIWKEVFGAPAGASTAPPAPTAPPDSRSAKKQTSGPRKAPKVEKLEIERVRPVLDAPGEQIATLAGPLQRLGKKAQIYGVLHASQTAFGLEALTMPEFRAAAEKFRLKFSEGTLTSYLSKAAPVDELAVDAGPNGEKLFKLLPAGAALVDEAINAAKKE